MSKSSELKAAVRSLQERPGDPAVAQQLCALSAEDPDAAKDAHQEVLKVEPFEHTVDLGLPARQIYRRHNLVMPQPVAVVEPESREELKATVQRAATDWRSLRGIGSEYAFSNIAFTEGFAIRMPPKMNRMLAVDVNVMKPLREQLVSFEAGATVGRISDYLDRYGLAFHNQPGFDELTYVGAMSAGGHGSGISIGPLSAHVRSLHMLTVNQEHRAVEIRVEPRDGITDPQKFRAAHPDVELLQDDDAFRAAVVSAGSFGVIYSLVISVRKQHFLRETRQKFRWADVKARLPELLGSKYHSIAIWVNPYLVKGETHCVLGTYEEDAGPRRGARGIGIIFGGTRVLTDIVGFWARTNPKAIPSLVDAAISSTQSANVVMPAREALSFGPPNKIPVMASNSGFDVKDTVAATEATMRLLQERAKDHNLYMTSPLGLRFVRGTDAFLSPQYGRDTCMMETPTLSSTPRGGETLAAIHSMLARQFRARPHWGQINLHEAAVLQGLFPRLRDFVDAFAAFNPHGFFDNAFTDQMGLRNLADTI
ncbi:MAG TPA: D-arabinono-1,4-lactone oxidase [Polyangiaceae bacterium]|nr:D-arabinono-1,4-lactone oxidase [Polyangiaceae bacterium]